VVSFTPWPLLPQRMSPLYQLDRRLGGPQSRFGRGGEEKHSQVFESISLLSYVSYVCHSILLYISFKLSVNAVFVSDPSLVRFL
jgi:hypothetical protein